MTKTKGFQDTAKVAAAWRQGALIAECRKTYLAAVRAEEDAPTVELAWKAAAASEKALRDLQAARAGLPLPSVVARTARMVARAAKTALRALANIGRAILGPLTEAAKVVAVSTAPARKRIATVFARTYNRVAERMRVHTVQVEIDGEMDLVEICELAHEMGASRGARTPAGIYEVQTDEGVWSNNGTRLLTMNNDDVKPTTAFRSWDSIEAAE